MSDPKSTYGEPVEEPTHDGDVVGRANEGLADAEAARRDAAAREAADAAPSTSTGPLRADLNGRSADAADEPVSDQPVSDAPEPASAVHASAYDAPATSVYDAPGTGDAPRVTASEPSGEHHEHDTYAAAPERRDHDVYAAPAATGGALGAGAAATSGFGGQPIFVQAPEAPRPRSNRAAAAGIGILAALSFGALYLAAWLGIGALEGDVDLAGVGTTALEALATWSFWVPVVVFFLAFWLLGAAINRGRWGLWVILGLLVGLAAYGGHLLGQLFQAPFWMLTAREGAELLEGQYLAPLAIAAFVFARELTIWFGAWVASRGRRVTELNVAAQREYERTLEAGPQLVRP
ncbi:ABC transporter [Microbacterium aureliae]